jgi:GLPGLI family protein
MFINHLLKISIVFTFLVSSTLIFAQSFEGQVKYAMSYKDLPAEMAQFQSMLPTEATATVKGHMFKMEQPMGMGMKQVTIMDNKQESGVLLMDMMGKKNAIVMSPEKRKEFENNNDAADIKYLNETKQIAGYTCKKAIIKPKDSDFEMVVFYTEDIKGIVHHQTKGVKGFPLEYSINSGMFTVQLTAEKVTKTKISDSEFSIPPGYENITFEQFQKSIGQ